jgi:hypothetical protein
LNAIETQVLYRTRDLKQILADVRGKPVPDRTLRWWRNTLGIEPGYCNTYDSSDLAILISLVQWLNKGGTIAAFKDQLKQQVNANI